MQDLGRPAGGQMTGREVALAALGAVLLAVAMTWPLVRHLGTDIGKDIGDPLLETWQLAWIGHALLHQPLDLWQANMFWPHADSLAFTDALIGYSPAALVAQRSPETALVVYNLVFLFAYTLAFLGAYLLARELGTGRLGGVAAGAAFAYAPWKLAQNGHLHVISSGGIPLAFFLLVRGYRRRSVVLVLGGWLVAAWQMTLGFGLGLQFAYLLAGLGIVAGVVLARRGMLDRRVVTGTVVGVAVFVSATVFQARPYLAVADEFPEARRAPAYIAEHSPGPRSFLAAPAQSWLWADATFRARAPILAPDEATLFPGLTISVLALAGALGSVYSRRLRLGLAGGVLVCAVLSLGLRVEGPEQYLMPYRLLYEFAPGWDGVRTPGRINTLTSLGLALLAGAGLCVFLRFVRRRYASRHAVVALSSVAGVLSVVAILLEGLGPLTHPTVPPVPPGQRFATAPVYNVPSGFHADLIYSYWSTDGFPATVNGAGGFDPDSYDHLRKVTQPFPDARSVAALRDLGVRTVVFHPELAPGTAWEDVAERRISHLRLRRETVDGVVLFRLR